MSFTRRLQLGTAGIALAFAACGAEEVTATNSVGTVPEQVEIAEEGSQAEANVDQPAPTTTTTTPIFETTTTTTSLDATDFTTTSGPPDANIDVVEGQTTTTGPPQELSLDAVPGGPSTTALGPGATDLFNPEAADAIAAYDAYIADIVRTFNLVANGDSTVADIAMTFSHYDPALAGEPIDQAAEKVHECLTSNVDVDDSFSTLEYHHEHINQVRLTDSVWILTVSIGLTVDGEQGPASDNNFIVTNNGVGPTLAATIDDDCDLEISESAKQLIEQARDQLGTNAVTLPD